MNSLTLLLLVLSPAALGAPAKGSPGAADAKLCALARAGRLTPALLLEGEGRSPGSLTDAEVSALESYYTCRAGGSTADGCRPLEAVARRIGDPVPRCRRLAAESRLAAAAVGGRPVERACAELFDVVGYKASAARRQALCRFYSRIIASGSDDCSRIAREGLEPRLAAEACRNMIWVRGRPGDCRDPLHDRECPALAELVAGLRSPQACQASGLCEAVLGRPDACEEQGRQAVAVFAKRLTLDKRCAQGAGGKEENAQTRLRREREEAEWKLKDAEKQARDRRRDQEKQAKAAAARQAFDAKQKAKDERLAARRKAKEAAAKKEYGVGQPMQSRPKWLEKALRTGQPPSPEEIRKEDQENKRRLEDQQR